MKTIAIRCFSRHSLPRQYLIRGLSVGNILARSEADIGIQQSVELTSYPGVDVVGPLSPELQIVTDYLAAIPKDSVHPDAGKSLSIAAGFRSDRRTDCGRARRQKVCTGAATLAAAT
jgi:hypothetical protein